MITCAVNRIIYWGSITCSNW